MLVREKREWNVGNFRLERLSKKVFFRHSREGLMILHKFCLTGGIPEKPSQFKVIPAKAGIQNLSDSMRNLDPRLRGGDVYLQGCNAGSSKYSSQPELVINHEAKAGIQCLC